VKTLKRQAGRTIVEIMIALTLGLVILAAALAVYSSSSSGSNLSESESRLNEDGLVALTLIQQQLHLASYSRQVTATTAGYTYTTNLGGAGVRGCSGGFASTTATYASLSCNGTSTTSSDGIAVRYEADVNNSLTIGSSPNVSPTNCVGNGIAASTTADATNAASISTYALADNRYFIRTTGTASGNPEFSCTGANGTNTAAKFDGPIPLLENVENMSFMYGVTTGTTTTQIVAYMSAAAIDTTFSSDPVDFRWRRVLSVKVCMLVRSAVKNPKYDGTDATSGTYYDCNNTKQSNSDGYLRRAFTTTVMLRNRCISGSSC
jgi:type IV pilus assembly protein PilW